MPLNMGYEIIFSYHLPTEVLELHGARPSAGIVLATKADMSSTRCHKLSYFLSLMILWHNSKWLMRNLMAISGWTSSIMSLEWWTLSFDVLYMYITLCIVWNVCGQRWKCLLTLSSLSHPIMDHILHPDACIWPWHIELCMKCLAFSNAYVLMKVIVQLSAVITRSSATGYRIRHSSNWGWTSIRICIHKRLNQHQLAFDWTLKTLLKMSGAKFCPGQMERKLFIS